MYLFKKNLPKNRKNIFAALDIGASKISCAIAKAASANSEETIDKLQLIGIGQQLSKGLKNGHIIDMEALEDGILNAVHSAEQMAGETIKEIYVNLPTSCIKSHSQELVLELTDGMVEEIHLKRLLTLEPERQIQGGEQIIHALPINYTLDGVSGIRDPKGMYGKNLSVTLHFITAPISILRNLQACIGRCHLDIAGFVATPYAAGISTLVEDEMQLGSTIIDLGGGTTSFVSFLEGSMITLGSVNVGGSHITQDLARGLSTPLAQAERLKTLYGNVLDSSTDERETIAVPQLGEISMPQSHHISKALLNTIIRSRAEEILELTWRRIKATGLHQLVAQRIVLTGGGAQLTGIKDFASNLFGQSVRIGAPTRIIGMNEITRSPLFATCAGLLEYAWRDSIGTQEQVIFSENTLKFWNKLSGWARENF